MEQSIKAILESSPITRSFNQYAKDICEKLKNEPGLKYSTKSPVSRETIKLGIQKLDTGRRLTGQDAEELSCYSLRSICLSAGKSDLTQQEQEELEQYRKAEGLKRAEDSTKPMRIPWEIAPILDTLVKVRMKKAGRKRINDEKCGEDLLVEVLKHLADVIQTTEKHTLEADYRMQTLLRMTSVQQLLWDGFMERWEQRKQVLFKKLRNLEPFQAMRIMGRLFLALDEAMAEALSAQEQQKEWIAGNEMLCQVTKELLSCRELLLRGEAAEEAADFQKKVKETKRGETERLYNELLCKIAEKQRSEGESSSDESVCHGVVNRTNTAAFWEKYCELRSYYSSRSERKSDLYKALQERMRKEIVSQFEVLHKMSPIFLTAEHLPDSQEFQSMTHAKKMLQFALQQLWYRLYPCLNYLTMYYSIHVFCVIRPVNQNAFFPPELVYNRENVQLLIELLEASCSQLQLDERFPRERVNSAWEKGESAFAQLYAEVTEPIFGCVSEEDSKKMQQLFTEYDNCQQNALIIAANRTELYSKLFACSYAESCICEIVEEARTVNNEFMTTAEN